MFIDLNDPADFTLENVAKLLASKNDDHHVQLRVTKSGIAELSDEIGGDNVDGLSFRFETWVSGNGYSGEAAAKDPEWVKSVFDDLSENWPNPKSTIIDH